MKTYGEDLLTHASLDKQYGSGLTKREYFSALAMQGVLVNSHSLDIFNLKTVAGISVEIADALIEALNKEEK